MQDSGSRSSPPRRFLGFLVVVAVLAGAISARYFLTDPNPAMGTGFEARRDLMGTVWKIQLGTTASERTKQAVEAAFEEVARIESVMSEWRPDSPLSAINAAAGKGPVTVPLELRDILQRSVEFSKLTGGAFDVTWKGMGRLWRFNDSFAVPSDEEIRTALTRVDYRQIVFEGDRVGLTKPGMAIGLGGIAKGYAVDRAAAVLREFGYRDFLVDGGGDVLVSGQRSGGSWRLGIRDPRGGREDLIAVLKLTSGAVASSGDYERFREVDGVRYHHIIDPRTGRPAGGCRAVSVLAPTAEEADALATALFVLGPEKGLEVAERREGTEVMIVDGQGRLRMTPGFRSIAELL